MQPTWKEVGQVAKDIGAVHAALLQSCYEYVERVNYTRPLLGRKEHC